MYYASFIGPKYTKFYHNWLLCTRMNKWGMSCVLSCGESFLSSKFVLFNRCYYCIFKCRAKIINLYFCLYNLANLSTFSQHCLILRGNSNRWQTVSCVNLTIWISCEQNGRTTEIDRYRGKYRAFNKYNGSIFFK